MKKILPFSAIFCAIVFLAGCQQQAVNQDQSPTPPSATQQPPEAATPSSDDQTYKNDVYGFEFTYPKTWEVDTARTSENSVVFINKEMPSGESREAINFNQNSENLPLNQVVQVVSDFMKDHGYIAQQLNRDYQINIGGEKTVRIITGEFGITLYMFLHNGTIFTIETQSLFNDDVLKTFQFTSLTE